MRHIFKPEDFNPTLGSEILLTSVQATEIANAKLAELIEQAPVVYGKIGDDGSFFNFTSIERTVKTHSARLMFIEELVTEPCKHEPINPRTYVAPTEGTFLVTLPMTARCKHCGVELIADWKAK